jgi:hypothetical protein
MIPYKSLRNISPDCVLAPCSRFSEEELGDHQLALPAHLPRSCPVVLRFMRNFIKVEFPDLGLLVTWKTLVVNVVEGGAIFTQ